LARLHAQLAGKPSAAATSGGAASGGALVSDAASVFYDNEVQNEKEQEQQVEVQDEEEEPPKVYPGLPTVEERFLTAMLQPGGATPSALAKLAAENEASGGNLVKRTGGDGRQQIRSLVQGAELIVKPAGELPWYPLPAFDMQGLPCAIAPPVELRFSTNHTAEKQPRDRDGEAMPRRLRNIIVVLHHLPESDDGLEDDKEWLTAVSLAEGQSLVLLLRDGAALSGAALGLASVEEGELLASTALYRERLATLRRGGVGPGRQLMRFLNNARRFSPAQVRT